MKKKRAILNFAGIIFVCILAVILTFVQFRIPGTSKDFVGFIRAIDLGIEYQSGTTLTFAVKNNTNDNSKFSSGVEAHALRIKDLLSNNNYDANVYSSGHSNIVVELFNEYSGEEISDLINTHNELYFRAEESTTAESYLTSSDIDYASGMQNSSYSSSSSSTPYGVYIQFTDEGKTNFSTLTSKVTSEGSKSGTVYIYLGDTLFQSITVSETIDQQYVFITGGSDMYTLSGANSYAAKINASKYDFAFEKSSISVITKNDATRNIMLTNVIGAVVVLICLVLLVLKFKKFGLVHCLTLIIGLLLQVIMLQAVPNLVLTSTAYFGSLLTFLIGFGFIYYMNSKIASEYALGKNIHSSLKFGYLKTYKLGLEIFISMLVSEIIFYIFGSTMLRYFAYAMIIGTAIYGLCTLVIPLLFNRLYLNINPARPKEYGFKREANVDELQEI